MSGIDGNAKCGNQAPHSSRSDYTLDFLKAAITGQPFE